MHQLAKKHPKVVSFLRALSGLLALTVTAQLSIWLSPGNHALSQYQQEV